MFYVQTVIHNFRQIQVLSPDISSNIIGRINHLAVSRGGREESDKPGALIFSFNSDRERAFSLLSDFLFTSKDILDQNAEILRGYTMVVEPLEGDSFTILRQLQKTFLLTRQENGIWTRLGGDLFRKNGLPLHPVGDIFGMSGPLNDKIDGALDWKSAAGFFSWAQDLDALGDGCSQIRITSARPETLAFLYRWFSSRGASAVPPCFFHRPGTMLDFAGPLVMGLDPSVVERLPEGLEEEEKNIWRDHQSWKTLLSPQVLNFQGDELERDLVSALEFWFRCARKLHPQLPKILILQEPSAWERHSREILDQVLETKEVRSHWRILMVESPGSERYRPHPEDLNLDWNEVRLLPGVPEKVDGLPLFFQLLAAKPLLRPEPEFIRIPRVIKSLAVIDRCSGLLHSRDVIEILQKAGEDPLVMEDVLARLEEEGIILNPQGLILANPQWCYRHLIPKDENRILESGMGRLLFTKWEQEGHPYSEAYAGLLFSLGFPGEGLKILESYLDFRISQLSWNSAANPSGAEGLPPHGDFLLVLRRRLPHDIPAPWKDQLILATASAKLRFALGQTPRVWGTHHLANFTKHFTPSTPQETSGEWLLQSGRFHLAVGRPQEGFTMVKKAYMVAQGLSNPSLQVRAGMELGLVFLKRGRASEAWEYFDMAGRLAETKGIIGEGYKAGLYEAAARLLWGNVSGALAVLEKLKPYGSLTGLHSWSLYHLFLKGRGLFELGKYEEAERVFLEAGAKASADQLWGALELLKRWAGRSKVYAGRPLEGRISLESLEKCQERDFFLAEAHYFSGDLSSALGLLSSQELKPSIPPLQGRLHWNTGFSLLEDLCHQDPSQSSILDILVEGFKAHVIGQMGQVDQAVSSLQALVTGKVLPLINPYLPLLLYWWAFPMAKQKAGPEAFHSTILGKGLKELQTRGSRLQNREDRYSFLNRSHWNAAYLAEAKKYKLA